MALTRFVILRRPRSGRLEGRAAANPAPLDKSTDAAFGASGAPTARRLSWRHIALAVGPGLVAMLADTDAGSVITVAQSGAEWGYRLLLPNILLIPFMFVAQEIAMRLALGTGCGIAELVGQHFGRVAAWILLAALAASCFGGLLSELSGLAGVAESFAVPVPPVIAGTVGGLILIVVTGSYRRVERISLLVGLFELAFLVMAWRAAPGLTRIAREAAAMPLADRGYLYLLAANLGTSIIPWVLLYQASASVDKGLGPAEIGAARLETLAGVVLCQTITSALLIAAAATLGSSDGGGGGGGAALATVGQIERAFTATLGGTIGHGIFVLGLSGGSLVATIVVCLTLAWSVGEVLGVRHSLEHEPSRAPWFYSVLILMLALGGASVASGINLVSLSVAAGVLNALLLPLLLLFLHRLSRIALPPPLRPRGAYAAFAAAAFAIAAAVALYSGIGGLL
jgi:Mn2+/Fe2+ NRAMP family transporter